ncbi:MAG: hypothetical protein ABI311_12655 [Gemmatimonadaceae bacterium]
MARSRGYRLSNSSFGRVTGGPTRLGKKPSAEALAFGDPLNFDSDCVNRLLELSKSLVKVVRFQVQRLLLAVQVAAGTCPDNGEPPQSGKANHHHTGKVEYVAIHHRSPLAAQQAAYHR